MEATKAHLQVMTNSVATDIFTVHEFHRKCKLKLPVNLVSCLAETVVLSSRQGNIQNTVKHITSVKKEIILQVYAEALFSTGLRPGEIMRSQPALHHN